MSSLCISDVQSRCGQVRIETGAEDADALSEFDARNALYGVFLQHLLATFRENAEVRRNHGPKPFPEAFVVDFRGV